VACPGIRGYFGDGCYGIEDWGIEHVGNPDPARGHTNHVSRGELSPPVVLTDVSGWAVGGLGLRAREILAAVHCGLGSGGTVATLATEAGHPPGPDRTTQRGVGVVAQGRRRRLPDPVSPAQEWGRPGLRHRRHNRFHRQTSTPCRDSQLPHQWGLM